MKPVFLDSIKRIWSIEKQERTKLFLVSTIFTLIITAYTICKEMKDVVFVEIVGADYVPKAKIAALIILIPAILFYSFLVNKVRRYQVLCFYAIAYGVLGLVFAFLLGHPTIGIQNTATGPHRLFGWIFYFFIEGYSPFIVSVAWAFANTVFSPKEARDGYAFLVASSKLGGVLSAGFGWYMLSHALMGSLAKQQLLLLLPSLVLLLVPLAVLLLLKKVPSEQLHGYEAAYEYQKEADKQQKKPGVFAGLLLILRTPYVFGIFGIIFLYEVVNAVLSFLRIIYAQGSSGGDIDQFSSKLFAMAFGYHLVGFCIALFGTQALLRRLGERRCLILVPIVVGLLIGAFLLIGTFAAFTFAFISMRAINYGFFYPVRESLYIPTVKAIKFQSKSWIDAFGVKLAKTSGASFNDFAQFMLRYGGLGIFQILNGAFFAIVIGAWIVVAYLLGKRYVTAIENNEVIGAAQESENQTTT